jgi:phosphatidylserine/phosphatidylglycerophosphate/cardiolipin synthase-like enzyme
VEDLQFITDRQIYDLVIQTALPRASRFLWIATSNLKDLYVEHESRMVPLLAVISKLIDKGVAVRLLHGKEPGPAFRADFDRYPNLIDGMELLLCPRVHFKSVIVDGLFAYSGSANLTGAGLGAKSSYRRNFEGGIVTTRPDLVKAIMQQFDRIWMGTECLPCQRKEHCEAYPEILGRGA